jgi:RNA polymerase sigma factor (sigma-70 family)
VFRRFAPYVARVAMRVLGPHGEVDDLVQDVFLDAHRGLRSLREVDAVKGWLATVTVRKARRRLRRQRVLALIGLDAPIDPDLSIDPSRSPEERALITSAYRVLDEISSDARIAWVLRCLEGEPLERVAEVLGISRATAHGGCVRPKRPSKERSAMREGTTERATSAERATRAMGSIDPRWDAARTEHALTGLHRRRRRRRALFGAAVVGTSALAAAALFALLPARVSPTAEVAHVPTPAVIESPATGNGPIRFADGSVVTPGEATEVVVDAVSDERIALHLDTGSIDVEVTPRPERPFEIDCGPVHVAVLGTGFTVERRGEQAFVRVVHGRVRVSWENLDAPRSEELGAGEEGLFPRAAPTASAASSPHEPAPELDRPRPRVVETSDERADWRPLAERGDYDAA